jgi:hypothetical protein
VRWTRNSDHLVAILDHGYEARRMIRKRSTGPLSHFCQRSGGYGIYAIRLSMVWQAAGRVLIQLAGSRASSASGAGWCMSFSKTHSK